MLRCFNPRACVRRDLRDLPCSVIWIGFQSTRLRKARPQTEGTPRQCLEFQSTRLRKARPTRVVSVDVQINGFNPRACVRRDRGGLPISLRVHCFNPRACVRRDQRRQVAIPEKSGVSIHAPA